MKAFVEILTGNPVGIIRCGELTDAYGRPFDYAVVLEVLGSTALIKALVSDGRFGMRHAGPILEIARRFGKPDWERF